MKIHITGVFTEEGRDHPTKRFLWPFLLIQKFEAVLVLDFVVAVTFHISKKKKT